MRRGRSRAAGTEGESPSPQQPGPTAWPEGGARSYLCTTMRSVSLSFRRSALAAPLGTAACLLGLVGCAALSPKDCLEVPKLIAKVENSSGVVRAENELDLRAARIRCQLDLAGLGQREVAKTENLPAFRLDQWMLLVKTLGAGLRSRFLTASTFGP